MENDINKQIEDSFSEAFKEIGDGFKEVGREFAAAFGVNIKSKPPTTADEHSDECGNECSKEPVRQEITSKETSGPVAVCKSCGANLKSGVRFCSKCGTKVAIDEPTEGAPKLKSCPKCGKLLAIHLKFCTECGTMVAIDAPKVEENAAKVTENQPDNQIANEPKRSIEQQIEVLQKLKALVDDGVLSQEEFEQKKKEIL